MPNIFDWTKEEIITCAKAKLHKDFGKWYNEVDLFLVTSCSGGYAKLHYDGFMMVTVQQRELEDFYA